MGRGTNSGQVGQSWPQNYFFCHFLRFGLIDLLELADDDSLEQCTTTSGGKIHTKNLEPKFGSKLGSELGFSPFSQVWFISFPVNSIGWQLGMSYWKFGVAKLCLKLGFLHFLEFASLVFFDISQDCSLRQCLTSSTAETSKKKKHCSRN